MSHSRDDDKYKQQFNKVMKELQDNVQKGIKVLKSVGNSIEELEKMRAGIDAKLREEYKYTHELKHGKGQGPDKEAKHTIDPIKPR